MGFEPVPPFRVRVELGVMIIKTNFTFPRSTNWSHIINQTDRKSPWLEEKILILMVTRETNFFPFNEDQMLNLISFLMAYQPSLII